MMTLEQREERKAEQEVFRRLRAIRREIRKERERMGATAYRDYVHRELMEDAENYCRANPGVHILKFDDDSYMLQNSDDMEKYCRTHPGVHIVKVGDDYMVKNIDDTPQP